LMPWSVLKMLIFKPKASLNSRWFSCCFFMVRFR
jgi:hypothetical protein